ncbi:MAG: hypothetical protein HZC02_00690 [Candidatus Levybacteria bacterium]|nr:hypothetical protein [Candidatus Levybacteria bacterium]
MYKKPAIVIAVITILGTGLFLSRPVFADDTAIDPVSSLVQKLADRFGLNKSDVKAVFDEHKKEMVDKMQDKNEERLSQLVTEGKITVEQKTLILNKMKELQDRREASKDSFKDLSADERKAKMQEQKTALENWAKENGIDLKYLMPFGHKGFGRMPKAMN